MIQSLLLFLFGFLSAGLLALLLLPAVWNRAVGLTRRSIEAALPTTLEEINAKSDQLRAHHAVEQRKTEQQRDEAARKAATTMVESGRAQARLSELTRAHNELKQHSEALRLETEDLRAALKSQDSRLADIGVEARMAKENLAKSQSELERIGALYEEAALNSSSHQDKMLEQEDRIEKLQRQLGAGVKAPTSPQITDNAALQKLEDENKRLLAELAQVRQAAIKSGKDRAVGDRELRETMLDLAAQVVRATAREPDQAQKIEQALAMPERAPEGAVANVISLASRIKKPKD